MKRPKKSPIHLPREIRRKDYTLSGYVLADHPTEQDAYTVTTPKGESVTVPHYVGWNDTPPALPDYILAECKRQECADSLISMRHRESPQEHGSDETPRGVAGANR